MSEALDQLNGRQDWRFFEQELVPLFLARAQNAPERLREYFNFLMLNQDNISGALIVNVGGPSRPDIRSIRKHEYLNSAFESGQAYDAKCYGSDSPITTTEFDQATRYLWTDPGKPSSVVIITKTDRVTVWDEVLRMRERMGHGSIIIITKKLLVELANVIGAADALVDHIDQYLASDPNRTEP